jgi:hypothetical protein
MYEKHTVTTKKHHANARIPQYTVYKVREGCFFSVSSEKVQRTPLFACTKSFKS